MEKEGKRSGPWGGGTEIERKINSSEKLDLAFQEWVGSIRSKERRHFRAFIQGR